MKKAASSAQNSNNYKKVSLESTTLLWKTTGVLYLHFLVHQTDY